MTYVEFLERRRHARVEYRTEVSYADLESAVERQNNAQKRNYICGKSVDISLSGLKILTPEPLKEGTVLEIIFILHEQLAIIDTIGVVVWSSIDESGSCASAGLRFLSLTDRAKDAILKLTAKAEKF